MRLADLGKSQESLNARAEHVASFVREHAGWQAIEAELTLRCAELEHQILNGRLADDTYRRYSCERLGIMYALNTPQRLIDQADHGEDATDVAAD